MVAVDNEQRHFPGRRKREEPVGRVGEVDVADAVRRALALERDDRALDEGTELEADELEVHGASVYYHAADRIAGVHEIGCVVDVS